MKSSYSILCHLLAANTLGKYLILAKKELTWG